MINETDGLSPEETLVELLKQKKAKISVAESFTGGNISARIVSVSGASKVFYEGIVAYDSEAKEKRLYVSHSSISDDKPVSARVAEEMAKGLIATGKVDLSVSTTGIAGPESDDSNFPVGLCYIGVATKDGATSYKYNFSGSREEIIEKGTKEALLLAIKTIKKL